MEEENSSDKRILLEEVRESQLEIIGEKISKNLLYKGKKMQIESGRIIDDFFEKKNNL